MKKVYCLAAIFFLSISLFSLNNDYLTFTITPQFSLTNGSINEYVFDTRCKNTDNKLSQLDWDVSFIPTFGIEGEFDLFKYFNITLFGSVGIPKGSGHMQDYDWMNSLGGYDGLPVAWKLEDPTELTNYSIHTNELEKYVTFKAMVGGNIYLPAEIKLTPYAEYYYDFIAFNGTDGYGTYKINNWAKYPFSGKVISYKQETNAFLLGVKIKVDCVPHISLYSDFSLSPGTTFLNALDFHYHNRSNGFTVIGGTLYWDKFEGIWQINTSVRGQYSFNKTHKAGLSFAMQYVPVQRSITSSKNMDLNGKILDTQWQLLSCTGGTQRFIWSLGINYSFSL